MTSPEVDPLLRELLARASSAPTRRDRQLVVIVTAYLDGDYDRLDVLAREHLVDHPDAGKEAIDAAWREAGNEGTISTSLIGKVRRDLEQTGKGMAKAKSKARVGTGQRSSADSKSDARGAGPDRSGFLSAFFTLVGTHGLHVSVGLVWIVILGGQVMAKGEFAQKLGALLRGIAPAQSGGMP